MNQQRLLDWAIACLVTSIALTAVSYWRHSTPAEEQPPPVVVPLKVSYASADMWSYDLVIVEHAGEKVLFMRGPGHNTYGPLPSHWLDSAAKTKKD